MKPGPQSNFVQTEAAVANMIESIMVSAVLMVLLIVMLLLVNSSMMETPANQLSYVAFTDIGNGVSTRIVDVYAIAPSDGNITTNFDLPNDVAGRDYFVVVGPGTNPVDQDVQVSRELLVTHVSLAGIGASRGVEGNTTGSKGISKISYDSEGY
jgi:hypothetical protein